MGAFRRVEAEQAGPDALGILVPPGRRTFVILRPRALPWDLLLCRGSDDLAFRDLARDEASAAAQALWRALRDFAAGAAGAVEALPAADGSRVRAVLGAFTLLACLRRPGEPYTPLACGDAEARRVADRLAAALRPADDAEHELYFNVRFFDQTGG